VEVVVSGATRRGCGDDFAFQTLDFLRFPGFDQPLAVFAPLRPEEAWARAGELERQGEALSLYREGEFQKARLLFSALAAGNHGCGLYEIFSRRCERLLKERPDEWTGVWTPAPLRPASELE
jgi:hypothetical protein